MNRTVAVLFSLTLIVAPATGRQSAGRQYDCSLTEATAPAIRGVKLGMTTDQVIDLFRGSLKKDELDRVIERSKQPGEHGLSQLSFQVPSSGAPDQSSMDSIAVGLHGGRVVDIAVQYPVPSWDNIDQWVNKLSEAFKLPAARAWGPGTSEHPSKLLKCKNIEIEAGVQGGGGSIRLRNTEHTGSHGSGSPDKTRQSFKPN
jgi:hypothetical protein